MSQATLPSFSHRALFVLLCTAAGVAACTGAISPQATSGAEYHVSSSRPSAQVTVSNEGDRAIVEVHSDNGIGSASVKLVSGAWLGSIVMRFHLQGLESLQYLYDETVVQHHTNNLNVLLAIKKFDKLGG